MHFQGLALVLGKYRWPELIARQRKKDRGLDAYASGSQTQEKVGKGLAASITATLKKISGDAVTGKESFPDLRMLLFVTPVKVGNAARKQWEDAIRRDHGIELHIIEREEIITQMIMPENAALCASFLNLNVDAEPQVEKLIGKTKRAASAVTQAWAVKTKGHPLIDLTAVRLDSDSAESTEALSLEQINEALLQSRRLVLEGPAGRGKTTTLIQLAQCARTAGTPFIVELPAWTASRRGILDYIAGMPAFQVEGLTAADLARVQQTEPILFLLNGWNEVAETNSEQADSALRDLERDFPRAGIIVATRAHHLTPPLPGAVRLRLLRIRRAQRTAYLVARLGGGSAALCARIEADPSLDELTRTPFVLSEVASIFEAGAEIPSTKMGVLAKVLSLQEQRDEHRNALQGAPIFGRQMDYLKALATEMIRRGAVALPEADGRALVSTVTQELVSRGQIELKGAPGVLATLTAHHVLERVDYPQTTFQFEHQQLQEYYAALEVRAQLLELQDGDDEGVARFLADYVNDPAWAEPLRMIAATFADRTSDDATTTQNIQAGVKLVEMALAVDLVFAGELSQLCGAAVWNEVRATVEERLRTVYVIQNGCFRDYAIAAMLATGADAFNDIIVPLLSGPDRQRRLSTYMLWPDMQAASLGSNWREQVSSWSEEAQEDFISELLHHRLDGEVVAFAAENDSVALKKAAASGLMWIGSEGALTCILESMDAQTFEDVACEHADRMPLLLRADTVAAMWKFIGSGAQPLARLRTALDLIELGEKNLDDVVKDTVAVLSGSDLGLYPIERALECLRKIDPVWVSEWIAVQIAEGDLYGHEQWLPLATSIPDEVVQKYLRRLETEKLKNGSFGGMIAVIAACANAQLAASIFANFRRLQHKVDSEPNQRHEFEWDVMRQLEATFRSLPGDVAAAGVLLSITSGDALDMRVATTLLSRIARPDVEPLRIDDDDLKARLRAYLKSGVHLVLRRDDFKGEEKANLASSIAQVGKVEDMDDLVTIIGADIERVRRGRAARAAGDQGPLGNGGSMSYAGWHIASAMHVDTARAEQVLIDLLSEPEYLSGAADEMARDFLPKHERLFGRPLRLDFVWAEREGRIPQTGKDERRMRFAAALNTEIKRLRGPSQDGKHCVGLIALAKALAAIDGRRSVAAVLDVIVMPGQSQYICIEIIERLLMAGVILPENIVFALLDSILERMEKWRQDSDRYLVSRALVLCLFVHDPASGVAKVRDVLGKQRIWAYELREIVTALGECRSEAAIGLLYELASDAHEFGQCEENFINAFAALDSRHGGGLLLGFVDPSIRGIGPMMRLHREDALVARLTELAQRSSEVALRLQQLCECDLPAFNRHILSRVMEWLGTPDALVANLNLINDADSTPVPRGVRDQFTSTFVARRPDTQIPNVSTERARASNELRARLFKMAIEDTKRRKAATALLGLIEQWRLDYGRPSDGLRHPDFASGHPWPPMRS